MIDRVLVAVTGGIGAGKTTVTKMLEECGCKVFSCDEIYKEIAQTEDYLKKVKNLFPSVIEENGKLNRKKLGDIVFNDSGELKKLNALAHPMIMSELENRVKNEVGVIVCEVPLLFENNFEDRFDYIIIVYRNKNSRISAICARDVISENEVLQRMSNQYDYDSIGEFAQNVFLVRNDFNLKHLQDKVEEIFSVLKNKTVKPIP